MFWIHFCNSSVFHIQSVLIVIHHKQAIVFLADLSCFSQLQAAKTFIMDSIRKTLAATTVSRVISIALVYLTPPIFLAHGGPTLLGQWLALITLPVAFNLLDLGMPHIAGSFMAIHYARSNFRLYAEMFWSAILFTVCLSPFLFLIAWLLSPHLGAILPDYKNLQFLALLIATVIVQSQLLASIFGGIRGRGEIGAAMLGDVAGKALELSFVTIALRTSPDLASCLVGFIFARVCTIVGAAAWLFGRPNGFTALRFRPRLETFTSLLWPSFIYMLSTAAQLIYIQLPILALATIAGPASAAAYSTMRTLARTSSQFILPFLDPLRPQFSSAYGRGDIERVMSIFARSFQAVIWLGLLASVPLLVIGPFFFKAWTLQKLQFDPQTFGILVLSAFFFGCAQVCLVLLASIAHHKIYSAISFFSVLAAICLYLWIGGDQFHLALCLLGYDVIAATAGLLLVSNFGRMKLSLMLRNGIKPPRWVFAEISEWTSAGAARLGELVRRRK